MTFLNLVEASKKNMVYLVNAKEKSSMEDAWYYIKILDKLKQALFLQRVKGNINLPDYGTVLFRGWGKEPPEYIKQIVAEHYS